MTPTKTSILIDRGLNCMVMFEWNLAEPDNDMVRVLMVDAQLYGWPRSMPLRPIDCPPEIDILVGGATLSSPSGTKIRLVQDRHAYLTKDTARMVWQQLVSCGWELPELTVAH